MNWPLIARIKIFKDRLQSWASLLSFGMVSFLFLKNLYASDSLSIVHSWIPFLEISTLRVLIIFVPFIILILVTIVDVRYILPAEQAYFFQNNPEWKNRDKKEEK
jgi:hypothetical protein